jgi:hypothetical protein
MDKLKIYERALQLMAEEIISNDLLIEQIYPSGDPDAHVDIPEDLSKEIAITCKDYLAQAREELENG